jgi:hypothetical protein
MAEQEQIPATMDGHNLENCLIGEQDNYSEFSDSAVLVKYLSLGENMVHYNHTFNVYNHSFRALCLRQLHANESSVLDHWFYLLDSSGINAMRDMKYVEYRILHTRLFHSLVRGHIIRDGTSVIIAKKVNLMAGCRVTTVSAPCGVISVRPM